MLSGELLRNLRVHETLVLDGDRRRVWSGIHHGIITPMNVAGAVGDEDRIPVSERALRV